MVRYRDTLWCDGCGVEITWKPVVKGQHSYCCMKCLHGEVCDCGNDREDYLPDSKKTPAESLHLPLNENG
ncbi:MAG: hypothetical protein ACK2TT_02805 [Anaerolineales bacterium]